MDGVRDSKTVDGVKHEYITQGDVIRIVDTSGKTVAEYAYNGWAKFSMSPMQRIPKSAH